MAYSIRDTFSFLGVTVIPVLMEFMRHTYGLHGAYFLLGAISWNAVAAGILLRPSALEKNNEVMDASFAPTENIQGKDKSIQNAMLVLKGRIVSMVTLLFNFLSLSPVIHHPIFIVFLTVHALICYNFTVWAIFLVPFGTSLGFSSEHAVLFSSAGGIGGLFGKFLVSLIFYFDKMHPLAASVVPSVTWCLAVSCYVISDDYMVLLGTSLVSGFSLAYIDAATIAMFPRYVCAAHLRQGIVLNYLGSGLGVQLGGILSGK